MFGGVKGMMTCVPNPAMPLHFEQQGPSRERGIFGTDGPAGQPSMEVTTFRTQLGVSDSSPEEFLTRQFNGREFEKEKLADDEFSELSMQRLHIRALKAYELSKTDAVAEAKCILAIGKSNLVPEACNVLAFYSDSYEEALQHYTTAASQFSKHPNAVEMRQDFWNRLSLRPYMRAQHGKAVTLVKLGRWKEALEAFLVIEKEMDGKNNFGRHSSYVNWRYFVPLCYLRLGDYRGCLKFSERHKRHILLQTTSHPFQFSAAYCTIMLGKPFLDERMFHPSMDTLAGQECLVALGWRTLLGNAMTMELIISQPSSVPLDMSASIGGRRTPGNVHLYYHFFGPLWTGQVRLKLLAVYNLALMRLFCDISENGIILIPDPPSASWLPNQVDMKTLKGVELLEDLLQRKEGFSNESVPQWSHPLSVFAMHKKIPMALRVRLVDSFKRSKMDLNDPYQPSTIERMAYYAENGPSDSSSRPVIEALLSAFPPISVPKNFSRESGNAPWKALCMACEQGNYLPMDLILARMTPVQKSERLMQQLVDNMRFSSCYPCIHSPKRGCPRCLSDCPHDPYANFERCADVIIKHGLRTTPSKASHPLDRYIINSLDPKKKDNKERERKCSVCEKDTKFKCAGCGKTRYCSRECQVADWKTHKRDCKTKKK